ncbi:MAG: hypothetical protein ILM98_13000 [Kiritimatiellae bacterium]|nr:hypothetical protein [Kiritimatiellia bacterium]
MRYSLHQRRAFSEAFDILNGRDALCLVASTALSGAKAGGNFANDHSAYGRAPAASDMCFALMGALVAAGGVSVVLGLWALGKMTGGLLAKVRRPAYYPQERGRRERLARERRRVRDRFTTGACPKPDELLAQYAKARTGAREALRFGSMLCDLEAYCDNSLLRNEDGEIVGRNSGVKGWLGENCPGLLAHYKNAMRYKGLAEKFRQAAGAADPIPAAALAGENPGDALRLLCGGRSRKVTVRMKKANGHRAGMTVSGTYALEAGALEAAWKRAREMLKECEGKNDARLRCGKETAGGMAGGKTPGNGATEAVNRPRSGKEMKRWGEVARLERVVEERLGEVPTRGFAWSKWRIGVTAASDGDIRLASA